MFLEYRGTWEKNCWHERFGLHHKAKKDVRCFSRGTVNHEIEMTDVNRSAELLNYRKREAMTVLVTPTMISGTLGSLSYCVFWCVIISSLKTSGMVFGGSFGVFLWTLTQFSEEYAFFYCLLCHSTFTYESFKQNKALKSRGGPALCLYITDNLV